MRFWSLLLVFLMSCATQKAVGANQFALLPIGSSVAEVRKVLGPPDQTREMGEGAVEYRYIERLMVGTRVVEERHYCLLIKEGKVINKRVIYEEPSPFNINSYDLQTTSNEDDE